MAEGMSGNTPSLILVVDDEPSNVALMRAVLRSAGHEVVSAQDGATALQSARALRPQLILLDVMMPDIDGYTLCGQLKADESTRQIPIIFVTGRDDVEAEARGFALGAADYIVKPISVPVVLARVGTHLALYGQRRHLEGMFRDVMEFAPDAFILSDAQGRIVQINARAEQVFGYRRQELQGRPADMLQPARCHSPESGPNRSLTEGVGVLCLRKDGSEFPADVNVSPMSTNRGQLWMAVVRDVSERQQAQTELAESRQRLRELGAQNEAAREAERKHIAREVHDELGQVLTALRMELSLLDMRYGALAPALTTQTGTMKALVDHAIQGVRDVVGNLRPAALDMGLVPAIKWLCSEFSSRNAIPCVLHAPDDAVDLDDARAVVVFRIVQESLTNVSRYARANQVDITLENRGDALWIEVRDDGQGFDAAAVARTRSFGLLGMRERAIALGGHLEIDSHPGNGTTIRVAIPILVHVVAETP